MPISPLSTRGGGEGEVLLPAGLKIRITNISSEKTQMRITARIIPKSIAVPAGVRKQAVPQIVRELGLFEHVERFQEAQFPSITRAEIIRGTEPLTNAAKVAAREAQGEALEHAAPGLQLRKLHPRNSLYYWVFLE